jgi:hypothetical protein
VEPAFHLPLADDQSTGHFVGVEHLKKRGEPDLAKGSGDRRRLGALIRVFARSTLGRKPLRSVSSIATWNRHPPISACRRLSGAPARPASIHHRPTELERSTILG